VTQGLGGKRYFTDASGDMLYTYDGDAKNARCTGACLDQWVPLSAGALSHAVGDWSVVANDDGTRQWAFKGKPVYSFVNDKTPGIPMGDGAEGKWHAAIEYDAPLPPEIAIGKTEADTVYTEKATGRTLYFEGYKHRPYEMLSFNHPGILYGTVKCYNECAKTYPPLLASADAKPTGEWWIITRADGVRQWAFRGIPVYTYADDKPGRALASNTDDRTWTEIPANMPPSNNGAS
jgi:predicted lipoprotein with Yx(FWY)xxD motif